MPTDAIDLESPAMSTVAWTRTEGVFDRDDELGAAGHEQVVFCRDEDTGLRAIISMHSTILGPALGGSRFYPYPANQYRFDLADRTNILATGRGTLLFRPQ